MKKMLVACMMVIGVACGARAHTITCNLPDNGLGTVTTDHIEYTLTVDGSANVSMVGVGVFSAVAPIGGTAYLKDNLGNTVAGWTATYDSSDTGFTQDSRYFQNGTLVTGYDLFNSGANLMFENATGSNLAVGTYTFGFSVANATYAYGEVAMFVMGDEFSNDDWDSPVNSGQAPVHGLVGVVPEPCSFALLGLGAAALALRRRSRKA